MQDLSIFLGVILLALLQQNCLFLYLLWVMFGLIIRFFREDFFIFFLGFSARFSKGARCDPHPEDP